jgi:hypothetical protein
MVMEGAAVLPHFSFADDIALLTLGAPHDETAIVVPTNPSARQNSLVVHVHVSNLNVGLHGLSLPDYCRTPIFGGFGKS